MRVVILAALALCANAFVPSAPLFRQGAAASSRAITQKDISGLRTPVAADVMISVGEGENIDNAVKRFKREVNKSGHLLDLRFHRYHETNQEKAKRKAVQARRKARMMRLTLKKGLKV